MATHTRSIHQIHQIRSTKRRVSSTKTANSSKLQSTHGRCEMDSHADTCVAGSNCVILHFTGQECDVSPYHSGYDDMKNVPIVSAATAWQCPETGQTFILVYNEAIWMGDQLPYSLINPNQLRHYGTIVQDNPCMEAPLSITTEDHEFSMELTMDGTICYADTHTPSEYELSNCPHIVLTSPHPWDPRNVSFPKHDKRKCSGMESGSRKVSFMESYLSQDFEEESIFSLDKIKMKIASMKVKEPAKAPPPLSKPDIDSGATDIPTLHTFESSARHTDVSPEDLSERWGISLATAIKTLKSTTQKFLRSAILPLSRRYRTDRMFQRKTLAGDWSTDTMDGKFKSIEGNRYAQVFANKSYFAQIYPMDSKSKAGDALRLFCQEFGVPERLTFDGSKEQTQKKTEFMKQIRTHNIDYHVSEPNLHNQNFVEGVIRELRRKWFRIMVRKRVPKELWDYGMRWVSETMALTYTTAGSLRGQVPLTNVTGETADISEYLDFGFYDEIWYKDNAGASKFEPGRWLGVSERTGRLMCYHILTQTGSVVSRSTVQRVTELEKSTADVKETFDQFNKNIVDKFKISDRGYLGDKPNPEDWTDLLEDDEDFKEEFNKIFSDENIPQADSSTPEVMDDTYLNMELALPRDSDGPEFARVTKRLRDANGIPIGTANENPILDTRIYEVEYMDGHRASLSANTIAENMFAQVDDEGHRFVLLDSIIDHRVNGKQLSKEDAFIVSKNGGKRRKETTKGWEILLQWKDGSTTWEQLKDVKESYPVQLSEYALQKKLIQEPAFAWWVPYVLKKRKIIIAKVKSKYWTRTHKFGIKIPKSVEEAKRLDRENGDTLWWDAICLEMKNVRIAFEEYDGNPADLPPGFQQIDCHMIFDIKMGENFRRKARMVAGGHQTSTPPSMSYSSVVSRDSVRIALTIAALNGLKVLACDLENAYLTAPCREKIWTVAGLEFGSDAGKVMIIVRALYGLKSSGAAFRSFLADHLFEMGYRPSQADPDVWLKPAIKSNGFKYWSIILCYVDDVLAINETPEETLKGIQLKFKLKNDKMEIPSSYLGADLTQMENNEGDLCWAMSATKYCQAIVKNVEDILAKKGQRLPSKCVTPITHGYRPETDCTTELSAEGLHWFQELIGCLRWAVEIGRVDILYETAILSKHLALPREGHLEQALHVFGYLKMRPKLRLLFDCGEPKVNEKWFTSYDWYDFYRNAEESIPTNIPEPRGKSMQITVFVDASHANNLANRRSQTGVLVFINKAPIQWYSKAQSAVEASTFGSEFIAMKTAVEMVEALRFKLRMFGVPLDNPANVFCDNEAVYQNTSIPESVLKKKHHSIAYHRCREAVAAGTVRIAKQGTEKNLADLFTKILTSTRRSFLLDRFTY